MARERLAAGELTVLDKNAIPRQGRYRLANANVPGCLLEPPGSDTLSRVDIDVADGIIKAVSPTGSTTTDNTVVDLDGSMVWPGLVDVHTHLDKGHIWPRRENPDGTFGGALSAVAEDRARNWSADDLAARMDFSLRCAYAHGTVAVRTHLDSVPPQHRITWPVFRDMRARWADRIHLQGVCLVSIDDLVEPLATELADRVAEADGVFGVVTYRSPDLEANLRRAFELAMQRGLDLDFHADESLDPSNGSLALIAELVREYAFPGHVHAGHCCSLSTQTGELADDTMRKLGAAGVSVSSQPLCNLYLQDRQPGRTPRLRGVTLLHELRTHGVPLALASDNTRDPFYAYGDLDLLEVFTQAVRIAHLDRPIDPWPAAVARTPARIMGLDAGVIEPGAKADLIVCEGRGFDEVLSRPQSRRVVLRDGRPIDSTPPDYRELDHLF